MCNKQHVQVSNQPRKKEKNIDTQALTKSSNRMARRSVVDSDGAFKGSTPAARAQA